MIGRNFRISGALSNADAVVDRTFWIGVYPGLGVERNRLHDRGAAWPLPGRVAGRRVRAAERSYATKRRT